MSSADLVQQLSGRALGHADSSRGRLEYPGQPWMKSSKWTLQKVAFFLFCKMFVSHRHQHRRLPEKHFSASPCLIQQCKRLPIQFSSDELWILKSWKEKWKLIRKKAMKSLFIFLFGEVKMSVRWTKFNLFIMPLFLVLTSLLLLT